MFVTTKAPGHHLYKIYCHFHDFTLKGCPLVLNFKYFGKFYNSYLSCVFFNLQTSVEQVLIWNDALGLMKQVSFCK